MDANNQKRIRVESRSFAVTHPWLYLVVASLFGAAVHADESGPMPFRQDGKWGYKNAAGQVVVTPQYDLAATFSDGLAIVVLNGKWGFIDKTGKVSWGGGKK